MAFQLVFAKVDRKHVGLGFGSAVSALLVLASAPVGSATVTLSGVNVNNCTYSAMQTDAAGNVTVACDTGTTQTPIDGVCGTANGTTVTAIPTGTAACATGSVTGMNAITNMTWSCSGLNGGNPSPQCSATYSPPPPPPPPSGDCGAVPSSFQVVEEGGSAYSSAAWAPRTGTLVGQLPVGAGMALAVPVDLAATGFPYGFKLSDGTGGAKAYVLSKCPGSNVPVAINGVQQNGTASVNGDTRFDYCNLASMYGRWGDVGNFYNNSINLSRQYTCFMPPTAQKYYLNVLNTGTSAVGFQIRLYPQTN